MAGKEKVDVEVNAPYDRVVVNTAEDAAMAFLRGQMTEDELKEAAASFGVQPGELMLAPDRLERPDDAFENKLPDEIYKPTREHNPDLKERLETANEKQQEREKAAKETDKSLGEVKQVEVVPAGTVASAKDREQTSKEDTPTSKTPELKTSAGSKSDK